MRKQLYITLFLLATYLSGFSQTASPQVLGSGGGNTNVNGFQVDYNIGDLVIQTSGTGPIITQGFEQPELGDISLSVLGLNLRVSNQNNYAHLYFSTVQEFKTDHFIVERSSDGFHFDTLTVIPTKAYKGYSMFPLHYSYIDPLLIESIRYYRLAEVDQNGAYTYSAVQSVKSLAAATPESLKVFPNPASTTLQVVLGDHDQTGKIKLLIYSASGALLLQKDVNDQSETTIQLGTLAPGVYILTAEKNGSIRKTKFIKK